MKTIDTTARIYVGTYAKYNNGSIAGAWIELDGMDADSFAEACAELHKDEADPELMFQDWEGCPEGMVHESSIDAGLWPWLELSDDDKTTVAAYREHVDQSGTIETALGAYEGTYDSPEDWAEQFLEEIGAFAVGVRWSLLRDYFDFEAYARDARLGGDVTFADVGYREVMVFNNNR